MAQRAVLEVNVSTTPNECATALARIVGELESVAKDEAIQTRQYKHEYRSKESLFDAIRPKLADAGVVMAMRVRDVLPGPFDGVIVIVDFVFTHGPSGHIVECAGVGQGNDSGDKATSKALTSAVRSFMDNQFMLGLETDRDLYRQEDQPRQRRERESVQREPAQRERPFDREATWDWIFQNVKLHADELAAYLEGHWLPKVANASDLDVASDDDVRTLARWIQDNPEAATTKIEDRLDEMGYFGEPEPASDDDAY